MNICFLVEKHRIPSPGREDGDGSESTPITSHSAPHANPNRPNIDSNGNLSSSAGNPPAKVELIHLPQTNIRLEKLPPMRPDKVELQEKAPKTPLVQVIKIN